MPTNALPVPARATLYPPARSTRRGVVHPLEGTSATEALCVPARWRCTCLQGQARIPARVIDRHARSPSNSAPCALCYSTLRSNTHAMRSKFYFILHIALHLTDAIIFPKYIKKLLSEKREAETKRNLETLKRFRLPFSASI